MVSGADIVHRFLNLEDFLVDVALVSNICSVNPPTTEVMGFPPLLWVAAF